MNRTPDLRNMGRNALPAFAVDDVRERPTRVLVRADIAVLARVRRLVAYGPYAEKMRDVVESQGGRFIRSGRVDSKVIGEDVDPEFDVFALIEYPYRQKFLEIAGSEKVREFGEHRSAGLEMQWLIATAETRM